MGLAPVTVGMQNIESISASADLKKEREKSTLRTRAKKIKLWRQALSDLFERVLMYDDYLNNRAIGEYEIEIEFPQYAMPTIDERIGTIGQAVQLNIMSIEKAVEELYPDLTDEERNQIVVDIKLEQGIPLLQQNITEE